LDPGPTQTAVPPVAGVAVYPRNATRWNVRAATKNETGRQNIKKYINAKKKKAAARTEKIAANA